eukprot:scaffold2504_cov94-Cylindrotheca_fusiformis.AAC.8
MPTVRHPSVGAEAKGMAHDCLRSIQKFYGFRLEDMEKTVRPKIKISYDESRGGSSSARSTCNGARLVGWLLAANFDQR